MIDSSKKCSKCKEVKEVGSFYKDKRRPDGLCSQCKDCQKLRYINNRERILLRCKNYTINNKKSISEYDKKYYMAHKDEINNRHKQYCKDNKAAIDSSRKVYTERNKENISEQKKVYRKNNRERICAQKKEYYNNNLDSVLRRRNSNAKYKLYYDKLTIDEAPKLAEDGASLEVKCRYCGKYFIPNSLQVISRVQALNSTSLGDAFLYCSDNCKKVCPVYRRHKFPKVSKHTTSREVDSLIRQMCFELDNWECQKCGEKVKDVILHCHHILGYAQNPGLGNDIDNVITLCKKCHKEVHTRIGCRYVDLQKNCVTKDLKE